MLYPAPAVLLQSRRFASGRAGCEDRRMARIGARRRGFSLVELLVVIGIVVILLSIFVPYVAKVRETENRARCAENLRTILSGLQNYAHGNHDVLPRVVYDPAHNPEGYCAYTGAASPDPFSADSQVRPNDVTASLWLLVRAGLAQPALFVCPSASQSVDSSSPSEWRKRSNFRGRRYLSYSYASPFSGAPGYTLNDYLPADFALLADMNPGKSAADSDVTWPAYSDPPLELARANSKNHGRAGQNVLYADGHVAFQTTPYCGVGKGLLRDNIYTALQQRPVQKGQNVPTERNGVIGRDTGPAWDRDSYLVPTEQD
jgi:prepilin-type N-terminal cleavage/methylation domain-containing protein/prepilin-type processing-associated H-X9-DG protein